MPAETRNVDRDLAVAAERLAAIVGRAHGDREAVRTKIAPDGLIHLASPDGQLVLGTALARVSRPIVLEEWHHLSSQAQAVGAIPVLVLPHLPPSLRDLAANDGINWVDRAGNATISAPPLLVQVEGKRQRPVRLAPGLDPFTPRSSNVVRHLLADPQREWRQKTLVERTGLSQSQTSKVLAALQELALVGQGDNGGLRVTDPGGLLDAWADAYSYRRQEIVPAHMSGEGMGLARDLGDRLQQAGITYWFTGLPAAWAYDQFARFRLASVYVNADPEIVLDELDLRSAERGANIHLIDSGYQQLEVGQAEPEGLRCVHPAQVYLDLLGLPERAREAAEHLRPLALVSGQP